MVLKLYEKLTAFTVEHDLKSLTQLQVYECFFQMIIRKKSPINFRLFLAAIDDIKYAPVAAEMMLGGLEKLLPQFSKEDSQADQTTKLKKCVDKETGEILDYLWFCRHQLTHFGIVPKFEKRPDIFESGTTEERYFDLGRLIIYAVFTCHARFHRKRSWEAWRRFILRTYIVTHPGKWRIPRITLLDHCKKVIFNSLALSIVAISFAIVLFIATFICGLGREIAGSIKKDSIVFAEMSREEVKEYVMDLSKAERAYYVAERQRNLNRARNYYRVGDTMRFEVDAATKELYEMARKEWLPNSYNYWGTVTVTTMGLSHTPVLKLMTQIPSGHRYMKRREGSKRKVNKVSQYYDTISQYYYCDLTCTNDQYNTKHEQNKIRAFAKEISKRAKVQYLIVAAPKDSKAANNAKSALTSAGVKNHQIKIIYDETRFANAEVYVKIL